MKPVKYWVPQQYFEREGITTAVKAVYFASDIDPLLKGMEWTSNKPTVPGWYWWRMSEKLPIMLRVTTGYSSMMAYLFSSDGRATTYVLNDELKDGEWAGPLEAPQ